jgi:hypothetical protein
MNTTIEEQLKKLKEEHETLVNEIETKTARVIELKKIIKDSEKLVEKAKGLLNGNQPKV